MSTSSEKKVLDNDLVVFRDETGCWRLEGPSISFFLNDEEDFRRIISLLELPFDDVKSDLGERFPYHILICLGLKHESDYWIALALSWVKFIKGQDAEVFIGELRSVALDNKVSQKNRHLARREVKRLSSK